MVQEVDGVGMVMALHLVEGFLITRSGPIDYKPTITSIEDVPNDQGGRVYLNFRGAR